MNKHLHPRPDTKAYSEPCYENNDKKILVKAYEKWQSAFLSIALELNHFTKIFNLESFWRKV